MDKVDETPLTAFCEPSVADVSSQNSNIQVPDIPSCFTLDRDTFGTPHTFELAQAAFGISLVQWSKFLIR